MKRSLLWIFSILMLLFALNSFGKSSYPLYPIVRVYPLSLGHKITMVNSSDEEVRFPAGTRAIETPDGLVVYNPKLNQYELFSTQSPISKEYFPHFNKCDDSKDQLELFINEAKEAIEQIKKGSFYQCKKIYDATAASYPDFASHYKNCDQYLQRTNSYLKKIMDKIELSLSQIKKNPHKLFDLKERHNRLMIDPKSNFNQITKFSRLLSQTFNPKLDGKLFSTTTLYIPISYQWFETKQELKSWIEKNWQNDQSVLFPFLGHSGEGIYNFENDKGYILLQKKFKQLQDFIKTIKLNDSPELRWLKSIDFSNPQIQRMIFIHNHTFESQNEGQNNAWQDFIPTDQSIGCFRSNSVYSTLIHESNVNAGRYIYFGEDTHGQLDANQSVKALLRNQSDNLNLHTLKGLVSREFYIQLIYLANILTDD